MTATILAGDVKNYVEPFFGSGAVLFLRPGGAGQIETVNDADGFVANFWRAVKRDKDAVAGVNAPGRREQLREYLGEFSQRLERVRVCCGDWSRVCTKAVTFNHGLTGVFLDPPYADTANRASNLYAVDCLQVAHKVCEWAIEHGKRDDMRVVLAGYEGEHAMPDDWAVYEWTASGGYANLGDGNGQENRKRERLWFSPACIDHRTATAPLFGAAQ